VLLPRVAVGIDRLLHRLVESARDPVPVRDEDRLQLGQAEPGDEVVAAFQPLGVLYGKRLQRQQETRNSSFCDVTMND
jgi:hypothetical protein